MGYERVLLTGWSRREVLSTLVFAVTAAFLVGTALMLATAGAYTATLEDDLSGTAAVADFDTVAGAETAATAEGIVLPTATVEASLNGERRTVTVVGVPASAPEVVSGGSVAWRDARLPPSGEVTGPVDARRTVTFEADDRAVTAPVRPPREETLFAPWWYTAPAGTVERLGPDGALLVEPDGTCAAPCESSPLIGTLPFLVGGFGQMLRTLAAAAGAGGLLVLVVVWGVTRMTVRDRAATIRTVRATGASPTRVLSVLTLRAAAVSGLGVALGALLGVGVTNLVVAVAGLFDVQLSFETALTPGVVQLLGAICVALFLGGVLGGLTAALPVVRCPPATVGRRTRSSRFRLTGRDSSAGGRTTGAADDGRHSLLARVAEACSPTIISPRAVVPTAATLTVFVVVVLLVGGFWATFAPLATASSGTIVESGAAHPLNSRVDAGYADRLRSQGVAASPEVLYATSVGGHPTLVRGANFSAFATVSDVSLRRGERPSGPAEAVVGEDLARTLGVETGETVTIGGSVSPGIRRIRIVGVFDGPGVLDDSLVVPLTTADDLATGDGTAHLIRTEPLSPSQAERLSGNGIVVTGLSAPDSTVAGGPAVVSVTVENFGATAQRREVTVTVDGSNRTKAVSLTPGERRVLEFEAALGVGRHRARVASFSQSFEVYDPETFRVPPELPDAAPPNAILYVPARLPNGTLVPDATVSVGGYDYRTNERGVAEVLLPGEPGTYELTIRKRGYRNATHTVAVEENATRTLSGRLSVSPASGTPTTEPNLTVTVANPWGTPLRRTLVLATPSQTEARNLTLGPGNVSRTSFNETGDSDTLPPGSYTFSLASRGGPDGRVTLATASYEVRGDASATASLSNPNAVYASGSGIGVTIDRVFGNVQVLFLVVVVLAALSTVGGTTATFAQAVHARGRVIGIRRATGGTDRQLLAVILRDACLLSVPATVLAGVVAGVVVFALQRAGLLMAFGARLTVPTAWPLLAVTAVSAVALSAVSAYLGGRRFLRVAPGWLLRWGPS